MSGLRRYWRCYWPHVILAEAALFFGWLLFYPREAPLSYDQLRAAHAYEDRNQLCNSLRYMPQQILDERVANACRAERERDEVYTSRLAEFWRKWDETP